MGGFIYFLLFREREAVWLRGDEYEVGGLQPQGHVSPAPVIETRYC